MYKDIFESIRNEAEKRNLRERTIQLYYSFNSASISSIVGILPLNSSGISFDNS